MSCAHCSELLAEVTELRRQLAYEVDRSKVQAFREALFITPQQALILTALYDAKGRAISKGHLLDLLPIVSGERVDTKIIDVQIWNLRKAIGQASVETYRATGYKLSAECRAKCDAVLSREAAA